ncbi:MAG: FtsX-like permease family protein [Myxococcota bacterium]
MNARFALAMARRELRAARRRFALYGACMAIGIAAIVALHSLRTSVDAAIDAQSRSLLGADVRITSRAPIEGELADAFGELEREHAKAPAARVLRFGTMALAPRTGRTRLVDVHAVEGGFPFYGAVETEPPGAWARIAGGARDAFGDPSAAGDAPLEAIVDPSLLVQLDAELGDEIALGDARFVARATVRRAPGGFGLATQAAPRLFIARRDVAATGLVTFGSLVEHIVYLAIERAPLDAWLDAHGPALEAARLRVQTVQRFRRELSGGFDRLARFLGLVGLAALALGAIGVASGVRVFVREKLDAVAVLRALGARPRDVVATYALLAVAFGLAAGAAGVLACAPLVALVPRFIASALPELPVAIDFALSPRAVVAGLGLGLAATGVCALGPLVDVARVEPLRALRRDFAAAGEGAPRAGRIALALVAGAAVLGASLWQAPSARVGLGFAAGLGAAVAALALAARLAMRAVRALAPERAPYWLRQGVANLFRPRNHTLATTVAIGFALFHLVALRTVQHSLLADLAADDTASRPNLVLFDVQRDQGDEVAAFLEGRGARVLERAPLVSARLAAFRGRRATDWLREPDLHRELRWALGREYRLTYRDDLRDTERIVAGTWWEPGARFAPDALPVSLEEDLARRLGAGLGDRVTWEVQGVDVDTVVTSVREVDWGRMATNFFVVVPPAVLERAPQSAVLLARLEGADERAELQRDLVARFPNVSAIDATAILGVLDAAMRQVETAVRAVGAFTLAVGLLVLLAAAGAVRGERAREAALLRVLGASSRTLARIAATEALALGALAAGVGTALALAGAWALVRGVFEAPFSVPWAEVARLALGTLAATALLGAAGGGRRGRRASPRALQRAALASR